MKDFEKWWHNEGSGITTIEAHDMEEHVKRVARIAWSNGAYMEKYKQEKENKMEETSIYEDMEEIKRLCDEIASGFGPDYEDDPRCGDEPDDEDYYRRVEADNADFYGYR